MKAFEIINEVEVPTGILDKHGNPMTKTVTPTSTVSTPKTTPKVKLAYDPNIPTRNQLSKSQVRKMARTGKVTVGGKTFTKNAILKNTKKKPSRSSMMLTNLLGTCEVDLHGKT